MWRTVILALLLAARGGEPALATEELTAVVTVHGTEYFIIRDEATRAISNWLKVGDNYKDYKLTRFDAKSETLELEAPNGHTTLRLPAARVRADESSTMAKTPFTLVQGSVDLKDGKIIYSSDAILRHKSFILRARDGPMESDLANPSIVSGNFMVLIPNGIVTVNHGTYDATKESILGSSISVAPKVSW